MTTRFIQAFFLAAAVFAFSSCATTTATTPVKDCSVDTALGLIDDVNSALATKDYEGGLKDLCTKWGICVVTKVVEEAAQSLFAKGEHDELAALQAQRAKDWLAAHKGQSSLQTEESMQIAVVNHSKRVSDTDAAYMADACNTQVMECARDWIVDPTPVVFYSKADGLPQESCRIMDIVDDLDAPGLLAYHRDFLGFIYGKVLAQLNITDTSVSLSHECLEEMIDPTCNQWRDMREGRRVALEVCDPVQGDTYGQIGRVMGTTRQMLVSNYVTKNWFDQAASGGVDRMGKLLAPFAMTAGGYMIVREQTGDVGSVFAAARTAGPRGALALAAKLERADSRVLKRLRAAA